MWYFLIYSAALPIFGLFFSFFPHLLICLRECSKCWILLSVSVGAGQSFCPTWYLNIHVVVYITLSWLGWASVDICKILVSGNVLPNISVMHHVTLKIWIFLHSKHVLTLSKQLQAQRISEMRQRCSPGMWMHEEVCSNQSEPCWDLSVKSESEEPSSQRHAVL